MTEPTSNSYIQQASDTWRDSGCKAGGRSIIVRGDADTKDPIVAEVYHESDVLTIIAASEMHKAIEECARVDAKIMAAERAPTGDDYSRVMDILLRAFAKTMQKAADVKATKSPIPANAGKPWDEKQDAALRVLIRANHSIPDIAHAMKRTTAGIIARCEHLGLVTNEWVQS